MPDVCDPSASIFSSAEVLCRCSDSESLLDIPTPDSAGPSLDNVNAGGPDEDPINRRIAGISAPGDDIGLYVKVPTGWSNLQLGPNLHIP